MTFHRMGQSGRAPQPLQVQPHKRTAYGIVTDMAKAGYVVREKDGRRNRYQIQAHLPLLEPASQERTVGEILALLAGADAAL